RDTKERKQILRDLLCLCCESPGRQELVDALAAHAPFFVRKDARSDLDDARQQVEDRDRVPLGLVAHAVAASVEFISDAGKRVVEEQQLHDLGKYGDLAAVLFKMPAVGGDPQTV